VKSDIHLPLEYAAVMLILLGWRVYEHYAKPPRQVAAVIASRKERTSVVQE
jgi:hypothetical protein